MEQIETQGKSWYDKYYKLMLAGPVILMVVSLIYLGYFYSKHNDFLNKDISLSGGTAITLTGNVDTSLLETALKQKFSDIGFRKLTDLTTGRQIAFVIESSASAEDLKLEIEKIIGNLTEENSSIEFTGPTLSQNFYKQLIKALISAFLLMSLVVFYLFGKSLKFKIILTLLTAITIFILIFIGFLFATPLIVIIFLSYLFLSIPSIAVIFAAFSDIVVTLALLNFLGLKISAAGIAAFLMLIGYSVDTDILLTTRALRGREETLNRRIYGAFKTGILMTSTALAAVLPAFFIVSGLPDSFRQIFLILALGLFADIINTWLTNASIIKWYCGKKGIK